MKEGFAKISQHGGGVAGGVAAHVDHAGQSRDVELIKLNGSIELAPILGLSDVIVDIVETGKTLAENGLVVLDTVCPISARMVANPASYRFQREEIDRLTARLQEEIR